MKNKSISIRVEEKRWRQMRKLVASLLPGPKVSDNTIANLLLFRGFQEIRKVGAK